MSLQDIMSQVDLTVFPEIALLIFAATFLAVAVRTGRRPQLEADRDLPLRDAGRRRETQEVCSE